MSSKQVRKLYRSDNRILGGVCAGIAEYANMDPTLARLIAVAVTIITMAWPGVLLYIIAWVIMPERK